MTALRRAATLAILAASLAGFAAAVTVSRAARRARLIPLFAPHTGRHQLRPAAASPSGGAAAGPAGALRPFPRNGVYLGTLPRRDSGQRPPWETAPIPALTGEMLP